MSGTPIPSGLLRVSPMRSRDGPSLGTRGASTTLSYVLTLSITALLISGLLIGTGALVEDRRESVARDELRVIGQHASARLMAADRLAATEPTALRVEGQFPDQVAGSTYTVRVNESDSTLHLTAAEIDVAVEVSFVTRHSVVETAVTGGDLQITRTDAGALEVQSQ